MRPQTIQVFLPDGNPTSIREASTIILARSSNGWREWKNKRGETLDQLKRN